jgi:N-acetylneuraminate synthase
MVGMNTFFIAEVAGNHRADLSRCLAFVETAARIGCDAVKFQLFRIDSLFAPEILERSAMHRKRKDWELPVSFLPAIAESCRAHGIAFCCTPFDLRAVEELAPHVDIYKIASYELIWPDLLSACGASGKPVILSTGMADLEECKRAAAVLRQAGCADLTLLHCVSDYPSRPEDANLSAMNTIRESCACKAGWSDHSVNPGVVYQAVFGFKASVVEFHLDLDGTGVEFASGHCWLPEPMAELIRHVRAGARAEGDGVKRAAESERTERLWRTDPRDGLRPFREVRAAFKGDDRDGA